MTRTRKPEPDHLAQRIHALELTILGHAIHNPEAAAEVFHALSSKDLVSSELEPLWARAAKLWQTHGRLSETLLVAYGEEWGTDALLRARRLWDVSRTWTVPTMIQQVSAAHSFSKAHRLMADGADVIQHAPFDPREAGAVLGQYEQRLAELATVVGAHKADDSLKAASRETLTAIETQKEPRLILSTGIEDLDRMLKGGLRPGGQTGVVGRSGHGKSCLGVSIAWQTARRGLRVLYVSKEMLREELAMRFLACHHMNPNVEEDARRGTVAPLDLDIDLHTSGFHIDSIAARVQREYNTGQGYALVVLDFLQVLDGNAEEKHEKLGEIAYKAKDIALNAECHVVSLLQMNRTGGKDADAGRCPRMSDIRGSSEIENALDNFIGITKVDEEVLHRDGDFYPVVLNVDKARGAKTGILEHDMSNPKYRLGAGTFRVWQEQVPMTQSEAIL